MPASTPDPIPWTDVAQAVGAILGAVVGGAALIVSVLVAVQARRDRDKAEEDLATEREYQAGEREHMALERAQAAKDRKYAVAGLVSAWVELVYVPSEDGTTYHRSATLHVANESREPVFNLSVVVSAGVPPVQLGPLAAPDRIPTLAAGRALSWDITVPLFAWDDTRDPRAEVQFRDSEQRLWNRELDGTLVERTGEPSGLEEKPSNEGEVVAQTGAVTPMNPMAIVLGFLHSLGDDEGPDALNDFVAPQSPLADLLEDGGYVDLRHHLENYDLMAHVRYPAPRVAHILIDADVEDGGPVRRVFGGPIERAARRLTLVLLLDGWRLYDYSGRGFEPHEIEFPEATL